MNFEQNLQSLIDTWKKITPKYGPPKKYTIHRQKQLKVILDSYDKISVPVEHFTDRFFGDSYFKEGQCEICGNKNKTDHNKSMHLRNIEAFPVVHAYALEILKRVGSYFVLVDGVILGDKDIKKDEDIRKNPQSTNHYTIDYESNIDYLINLWISPSENAEYLSVSTQKQLLLILESYNNRIPIKHFTNRLTTGQSYFKKGKCSICGNKIEQDLFKADYLLKTEAYPIIYSYLCNVLKRNNNSFVLNSEIELGRKKIYREGYIPSDLR